MEVKVKRTAYGTISIQIEKARSVSLTGVDYYDSCGETRQSWDLYAALEPADVAELCNAIRDLRDADHDEALSKGRNMPVPEPELAEVQW